MVQAGRAKSYVRKNAKTGAPIAVKEHERRSKDRLKSTQQNFFNRLVNNPYSKYYSPDQWKREVWRRVRKSYPDDSWQEYLDASESGEATNAVQAGTVKTYVRRDPRSPNPVVVPEHKRAGEGHHCGMCGSTSLAPGRTLCNTCMGKKHYTLGYDFENEDEGAPRDTGPHALTQKMSQVQRPWKFHPDHKPDQQAAIAGSKSADELSERAMLAGDWKLHSQAANAQLSAGHENHAVAKKVRGEQWADQKAYHYNLSEVAEAKGLEHQRMSQEIRTRDMKARKLTRKLKRAGREVQPKIAVSKSYADFVKQVAGGEHKDWAEEARKSLAREAKESNLPLSATEMEELVDAVKASEAEVSDAVSRLVAFNAALQHAHWLADTTTEEHETLGALCETMTGLTDTFAEVYMGKYGPLDDVNILIEPLDNPTAEGLALVDDLQAQFAPGADDDVLNILADMQAALNQSRYLLKAEEAALDDSVKSMNEIVTAEDREAIMAGRVKQYVRKGKTGAPVVVCVEEGKGEVVQAREATVQCTSGFPLRWSN
jgi:hypothetical protein